MQELVGTLIVLNTNTHHLTIEWQMGYMILMKIRCYRKHVTAIAQYFMKYFR
jgi:hypothetical protein